MKITNKFVLVLGAGSSMEYGYPSGLRLQELIIQRTRPLEKDIKSASDKFMYLKYPESKEANRVNSNNEYYEEIKSYFGKGLVENFSHDLEIIDAPSIDAFISMPINRAYRDVCKFAIVQSILSFEKKQMFLEKDGWYQKLYHILFPTNGHSLDFSNLTIISFNYDRSFENYFFEKIFALSGKKVEKSIEEFSKIKIFHPYGVINDAILPPEKIHRNWFRYGYCNDFVKSSRFKYESEAELISSLSSNIETIYEFRANEEYKGLRNAINDAEAIIFLGFSYHEDNLKVLDIKSGQLYGTSLQLTKQQYLNLKRLHPNIKLQSCSATQFMLQHVPFNSVTSTPYIESM